MYESAWYDSGQLVPNQITSASDEQPIVNGTASAGISTSYNRGNHIHAQQLIYDGNITATKFIKSGLLTTQVQRANGETINGLVDITTDQTIAGIETLNNTFQIIPTGADYNKGIRIAKATNGSCKIFFGVDQSQYSGQIECQWTVGIMINQVFMEQQFAICQSSDFDSNDRVLHISVDRNTITFNGNRFVDVATDQTITDVKTFGELVQIKPNGNSYNEGIRVSRSPSSDYSGIFLVVIQIKLLVHKKVSGIYQHALVVNQGLEFANILVMKIKGQ
ncbi:MAG: hypothetical protein EZS28_026368 [Streblomastix strix]|uniref:Uncharacterized protein n=1 Tax=Streblomastix strix TaxID=222440 RepID=A0A5J4V6P5_9EUKA|nr:MAG: hypothetical protein EZS28_026368 [Streblomastix strix]